MKVAWLIRADQSFQNKLGKIWRESWEWCAREIIRPWRFPSDFWSPRGQRDACRPLLRLALALPVRPRVVSVPVSAGKAGSAFPRDAVHPTYGIARRSVLPQKAPVSAPHTRAARCSVSGSICFFIVTFLIVQKYSKNCSFLKVK